MKQLALGFCIALFICSSCTKKVIKHSSVAVTLIHDVTDSLLLQPTGKFAISFFDFNADLNREVTFKSVLITDKLLNPCTTVQIEDGSQINVQTAAVVANYRKRQIKQFYRSVRNTITEMPKEYADCNKLRSSECYATLCDELARIAKVPAERKVVLVYSDMMENNTINFYNPSIRNQLKKNPELIIKALQAKRPMPDDLRGIKVYFLFRPKNQEEDSRFQDILKVYTRLFEERGATFAVQANESIYN